jgi:hypothetical protein
MILKTERNSLNSKIQSAINVFSFDSRFAIERIHGIPRSLRNDLGSKLERRALGIEISKCHLFTQTRHRRARTRVNRRNRRGCAKIDEAVDL